MFFFWIYCGVRVTSRISILYLLNIHSDFSCKRAGGEEPQLFVPITAVFVNLSLYWSTGGSGGSAVSEQYWTRNRDGTTRVQLSQQIAQDHIAVCEGVCACLIGMGQCFSRQSPDVSAVGEKMDEAQQSNVAPDPDSNGSVTTFIRIGLIHMLYSNTKHFSCTVLQKQGMIFCTPCNRKDFSCDLLLSKPGKDRAL